MATTRDYLTIVDALKDCRPVAGPGISDTDLTAMQEQHRWTVQAMAARLRATNPQFKPDLFRQAGGDL